MYAKVLIKAALLLLVINIALVGLIMHSMAWLVVAVFNLIALFVLLFQERSVFQTPPPTKRILFTTDVFGWIALGVGIVVAGLGAIRCKDTPPIIWGVLGGGIFYLLTVAIFHLAPHYRRESSIRVTSAVVVLVVLGLLAQGAGWVSLTGLGATHDNLVGRRQRTLQSIVVDEEVPLPPSTDPIDENGNDEEIDDEDLPNDELPTDTGTVLPNGSQGGRIFSQTTISQPGALTYGTFLPVLMETFSVPPSTNTYTFTYVDSNSSLYPSFVLARDYTMIGNSTNPTSNITCQVLMVLLGLVQSRDVNYTSATVLDAFWAEATQRGYTSYGCEERTAVATWADLP